MKKKPNKPTKLKSTPEMDKLFIEINHDFFNLWYSDEPLLKPKSCPIIRKICQFFLGH